MTATRPLRLAIAVVALTALAATGCAAPAGGTGRGSVADVAVATDPSGLNGTVIRTGFALPAAKFTDTAGRPFVPSRDARSPVTVVFFGYTHCPDVCNVVLANLAAAIRRSAPATQKRVEVLFVTTDPERDTPEVLRSYLDRFDRRYVGLTAALPTIRSAAASMHIAYEGKHDVTAGGYEVMHGTQITGFVRGKARVLWRAETTVRDLRSDLAALAALDG
jgi:protein SCO1/2